MRSLFKTMGIGTGGLVGLIALVVLITYVVGGARLNKTYAIAPEAINVPTDSASLERGRRLVNLALCTDCHAWNLGGQIMEDNPVFGRFVAANLTPGRGGIGSQYTDADWVRALRHGVRPDGRSLVITPAVYYYYLGDADAGAMIAYLKSIPAVDNELPATMLGPLGRLILFLPQTEWLPAERIDHTGPRPPAPAPGVTVAYGEYLARIGNCQVCHGRQRPGATVAWSEADFIKALRTGLRPDGTRLDRGYMPAIGLMSEDELMAVWLYLQTLPAEP